MAREALTLVGTVVGAYFGNPQLGYAIGSMVGSAVDPEVVKAPSIGDVSQQTSSEGVPCALYAGTAGGAGNLVYCSAPDVITVQEGGKGGDPVVESERAYVTFIIRIGASLFDGPGHRVGITALIKVWEDEKLVYDVSPTSQILAESAEYAQTFTFYPGNETQLPDPDVEAIEGVGNVSAYRGRAIFVKKRHDVTDRRGSVPGFRFEVAVEGAATSSGGGWFFGPAAVNGAAGGSQLYYLRADTPEDLVTATPTALPTEMGGGNLTRMSVVNDAIFFHGSSVAAVSFDRGGTWTACNVPLEPGFDVFWNGNYYYNGTLRSADGITWATTPNLPANTEYVVAKTYQDAIVAVLDTSVGGLSVSFDDGGTWTDYAHAHFGSLSVSDVKPGKGESFQFSINTTRGCFTDDWFETWAYNDFEGAPGPGGNLAFGYYSNDSDDVWIKKQRGQNSIARSTDGGDNFTEVLSIDFGGNTAPNIAWGAFKWAALRFAGGSPSQHYVNFSIEDAAEGTWSEVDYPLYGNGNNLVYTGPYLPGTITPGSTTLDQLILAAGRRCKVPDAIWNLPGLSAKVVKGAVLASQGYTAQDFINSLRWVFPSDGSCYDGQIHIHLRGGAVDLELDEDFMVDEQDDGEQDETLRNGDDKRRAPLRRPYKTNLMYPNARVGYMLTKATSPNYGDRGDAVSEVTLEIPIIVDETEAAQLADVLDKIGRADAEGELVRIFPEYLAAKAVPGSIARLTAGSLIRRLRVSGDRCGDGTVRLQMMVDRQYAYTSQATAEPVPEWPTPPPSLPGDTHVALMNLPALLDAHDLLGIYLAISGDPDTAWRGAAVDYRIAGTTAWTGLGIITRRAVMGTLLNTLPAASEFFTDATNPLRVALIGDDELETQTDAEWLSEGGACAIVYDDGTAEIIQPRDAQDDGDREWTLTYHQRGRLATVAGEHTFGDRFVVLAGATFLPLPSALMGQTLEFRITTVGTSTEIAPIYTLDWNPVHSQLEFPAAFLELTRDSGTLTGAWSPRWRFGTDVTPIRSINFDGWRVTLTDGSATETFTTADPEFSRSDSAFSGPITVTVEQLNRFTGAGPSISEII